MEFLDQQDQAGWKLLETMINCRRQRDALDPSKPARSAPKPLSEMSKEEAALIAAPDAFEMPEFRSDISRVPTARSLLDNALVAPLQRPWYAARQPPS